MPTLAAGANITLTLTANSSVTVMSRNAVLAEAVSGLGMNPGKIEEFQGHRQFGPFPNAGSFKLTAIGNDAQYEVAVGAAEKALRQVSTGCFVPNQQHASNLFSYSRSPHHARDDIKAMRLVMPNWYVNGSMIETNGAAAATWTATIEYPEGNFTAVKFDGSDSGTVSAGMNLISDSTQVSIPSGAKFWVRLYQNAPGKILWNNQYCGDGTAQAAFGLTSTACPDLTRGGDAAVVTAVEGGMITPAAIIAETARPAIGIVGDSISVGKGDVGDGGSLQSYLGRAFGGSYALLNVGVSSDTLVNFIASNAKRRSLINSYCSHVIVEYGSNDVINGRTAAQILADTITVLGYFPGKRLAVCTLTPRVTSSDGFITEANQTVLASEPVRIVVNAQRRNGLSTATVLGPAAVIFDIERDCESSYASGKWKVIPGTVSPAIASYTTDGIHPNRTGYIAIAGGINTSSFV